ELGVGFERAIVAGLHQANALTDDRSDAVRIRQLAAGDLGLALAHEAFGRSLGALFAGAAATDGAAAKIADAGDLAAAAAARAADLDARQAAARAARHADALNARERLFLIAARRAILEHVGDVSALTFVAERHVDAHRAGLLGPTRAASRLAARTRSGFGRRLLGGLLGAAAFPAGAAAAGLFHLGALLVFLDDDLGLRLLRLRFDDQRDETIGHFLEVRLARPIDGAQVRNESEMTNQREAQDRDQEPVERLRDRAAHRRRKLRTRLRRRRRDELEQDGRVADDHLAARFVVERKLPELTLAMRHALPALRQREHLL